MTEHVAIVGAGVLGASIAWRLAGAGHRVTMIDPEPGGVASPGSLAWLNASMADDPVYNSLRHDSLVLWKRMAGAIDAPPVVWPGTILWEQDHFDLDAICDSHQKLGRTVRWLTADDHKATEPNVANPPERALFCENDGFGLPRAITQWFLDRAMVVGATLLSGRTVDGFVTEGGRVTGVKSGKGHLTADKVVLAAGTGLPGLLASVGLKMAMDNRPGLLVTTTPVDRLITAMLATDGLHGWQGVDGRFLIGADFGGGEAFDDPDTHAANILARLIELLPGARGAEVDAYTVRTRPMPADGRPAVGPLGPGGLYVVSTHSGMTLAPVIGEAVLAEIGGQEDPRLAPYRPGRAALQG